MYPIYQKRMKTKNSKKMTTYMTHKSQPLSPPQPSTPNIPITSVTSQPYFTQYAKSTETQSQPTTRPKNKQAIVNAVDKTFIERSQKKRKLIVIPISILNKIQKLKHSKCSF